MDEDSVTVRVLREIRDRIDVTNQGVEALGKRVDQLSTRVEELVERADETNLRLSETNVTLNDVRGRVTEIAVHYQTRMTDLLLRVTAAEELEVRPSRCERDIELLKGKGA